MLVMHFHHHSSWKGVLSFLTAIGVFKVITACIDKKGTIELCKPFSLFQIEKDGGKKFFIAFENHVVLKVAVKSDKVGT